MRNASIVLAFLALTAGSATAAPLDLTDIVGSWVNPIGGTVSATQNVADQGTDKIRWGGTTDDIDTGSGYNFTPSGDIIGVPLGTPFALGLFEHVNEPILPGTPITSVDYDFAVTTNGVPALLSNTFLFEHNETFNSPPCPEGSTSICDDIVTISQVNLNQVIDVVGDIYFFNLLGFSNDGGTTISSMFLSPEGGTNDATLYGIVTSKPLEITAVPEPASLVLLGSGLLAVARRRAKKRIQ